MHLTSIALGLLLFGQADASRPPAQPETAAAVVQPATDAVQPAAATIVPEPTDRAVKAAAAVVTESADRAVESAAGAVAEAADSVQPPAPFQPIPPSGTEQTPGLQETPPAGGEPGGTFDRLRLAPRRNFAPLGEITAEPSRPAAEGSGSAIAPVTPTDAAPDAIPDAVPATAPAVAPVNQPAAGMPSTAPEAAPTRPLGVIEPSTRPAAAPTTNPPTAGATVDAAASDTAAEPAAPRQRRAMPPEMIAEALVLPTDGSLEGHPMTLVEAFSRAADTARRLDIAHAYWQLVEAVARYHYARQASDALAAQAARPEDAAALEAARASATAACETARLSVISAQHELAEAADLGATDALPLPADRPHVGIYRTRFDELYAMRAAPGRTRLIDRTLPIHRRAIDVRADAVHAAADAVEAMGDAYREGRADLASVLGCQRRLGQQQQALATSITQYNHEIAEYAFAAAPQQISAQALVGMLIRTGSTTETGGVVPATMGAAPTLAPTAGEVEPASLNEAIRPIPETGISPLRPNQPTLAPPRDSMPATGTPTLAPPRDTAPAAAPLGNLSPPPDSGAPTPAPPRTIVSPPATRTPTLAPPRDAIPTSGTPTLAPPRDSVPTAGSPTPAPPRTLVAPPREATPMSAAPVAAPAPVRKTPEATGIREPSLPPRTRMIPSGGAPGASTQDAAAAEDLAASEPAVRTAMKPQLQPLDASLAPSTALYSALADKDPAVRAKQLAGALNWDRSTPKENTAPVTLADCLQNYVGTERRGLIEAYWVCTHRAAEYQVLVQQVELLADLDATVLALRGQPLGAESMLALRAAREAAGADQLEAEAALAVAQFNLTQAAGRPTDSAWLTASTDPHAGPYDLKEELRRDRLAQSWPLRRAAAMVPSLYQNLVDYGTAVVTADSARAAATADYQAGRRTLDEVLANVAAQTRRTLAFLQTLTDYNQSIADYALAIVPPELPGDQLVQTLVMP